MENEDSETTLHTISCPHCGGTQFEHAENPKPEDKVTCVDCTATWRFDDFRRMGGEQALDAVKNEIKARLRNVLK